MRYITICVRRRNVIGGGVLITLTVLLLWTLALFTGAEKPIHHYLSESGKISKIAQSRKFSLFVDDVIFDQPWSIDNVTTIDDINYFLTDTNKRYIISDFTYSPGLGNLMFQYAALKSLSLKYGAELLVPVGCKLRRAFSLNATFISDKVFDQLIKMFYNDKVDFQICCKYYPPSTYQVFSNPNRNIEFLAGYFQSFRYFHPKQESLIRHEFKFLPEVEAKAKHIISLAKDAKINANIAALNELIFNNQTSMANESSAMNITYVGLHVRMGADITLNVKNLVHGHTTASKEYFQHAMEYFRSKYGNVMFIIASDNPRWVQRNIKPKINGEIYILKTRQREVDLATLAQCNATILSTGTFSWWAGYLAAGETVYYQNWPLKDSVLDFMVQKSEFFLPAWIPME